MPAAIKVMRLSILAAIGLSSTSVHAQDVETEEKERPAAPVCEDPKPLPSELLGGSGFVRCADGRVLREKAIWDLPGNPGRGCDVPKDQLLHASCLSDSECTARPFGSCTIDWSSGPGASCRCAYRCMSDLDCRIGYICAAGTAPGPGYKTCVRALDCRTNADCSSGQCEISEDRSILGGGGSVTMACRSSEDKCQSDEDCAGIGCETCDLNRKSGVWECAEACIVVGRPFLVQGEAALPDLVLGDAWIDAQELSASCLSQELAASAAAHWLAAARMEHASVAAFARFALQLMHLGAPPDLLQETTAAMQDEIAHAKACFALAKRYSGQARTAGTLEVSRSLEHELEPERIAVDVFLEGCVGESVAALEASEMGALATDSAVRDLLQVIAKDEHRHALLAWRSLRWMLVHLPSDQAQKVRHALSDCIATLRHELKGPIEVTEREGDELAGHGVPSPQRQQALRRQAIAQIVLPCATGLIEQPGTSPNRAQSFASTSPSLAS